MNVLIILFHGRPAISPVSRFHFSPPLHLKLIHYYWNINIILRLRQNLTKHRINSIVLLIITMINSTKSHPSPCRFLSRQRNNNSEVVDNTNRAIRSSGRHRRSARHVHPLTQSLYRYDLYRQPWHWNCHRLFLSESSRDT